MNKILRNKQFWIMLAAFLVRLLYATSIEKSYLSVDSGSWNSLALAIMQGEPYASTYRGPLYPLFLAGLYSLFSCDVIVVRIAQSVLGALTCLIVYHIGRKVFSPGAGTLSAILVCLYPYFIHMTGDIMSEILFAFLICLSILLLLLYQEKPSFKYSALTGICIGLTLLCKGTFLPFFLLSLLWLLAVPGLKPKLKIRAVLQLLLFVSLTFSPWVIRNYRHYNKIVVLGLSGQSLWLANNPQAMKLETLPEMNIDRLDTNFTWFDPKKYRDILKMPPLEADQTFRKEAKNYIFSNPGEFACLVFKRFLHYWRLYPIVATRRNKIIAMLTSGWILPLGWLGILLSLRNHRRKTILLISLLASFTLVHVVFVSTIRYRVPIDPIVIIFCSFAVLKLWSHAKVKFASLRAHH